MYKGAHQIEGFLKHFIAVIAFLDSSNLQPNNHQKSDGKDKNDSDNKRVDLVSHNFRSLIKCGTVSMLLLSSSEHF